MFSLEEEDDPEPQLSLTGNRAVKPQDPHILPEDAEPQELPGTYLTETLFLSRTKLRDVAESVVKNSRLKHLYLEGNNISIIPDSLFISLPKLLWLDLRNNHIASLPAKIGVHRCLKTLLLEGNPISELPPELGNVITLKGLHLRDCPIIFPPQHIVQQGPQIILQYLRSAMAKRPASVRLTPRVEVPVVEKLQLSELTASGVEEQDEAVDEIEMHRFRELKEKMILLDRAELGFTAQAGRNPGSRLPPLTKCKKVTTKATIVPELLLLDPQQWERPGERRQTAMKEKQALVEQKQKSKEALQRWRTRAKITPENISEDKQKHERLREDEPEMDLKPGDDSGSGSPQSRAPGVSITACEDRSDRELERQICAHIEEMQVQRRNPSHMTTTEQMAVAEEEEKEMKKLQTRLLERKRNQGRINENSWTVFTEDTWQSFLHS